MTAPLAELAGKIPHAWRVGPKRYVGILVPLALVALTWVLKHVLQQVGYLGGTNRFSPLWLIVFGSLVWHLALAWSERTYTATQRQQRALDGYRVTVAVPVHNEDPEALHIGLAALLAQTRLPQKIHVVENGQLDLDPRLAGVRAWFAEAAEAVGVVAVWEHIVTPGKRGGQIRVIKSDHDSDIFVTMDSDTVADKNCIAEALKPFADQRVASVAAVILAYNSKAALVRLTDAWLLTFQLAVRAAMGRLGCVLVNSGNFAAYRSTVVREAVSSYESEYFRGNKVEFSDDSLLTLFSHLRGRTVQQPSAFAFTVLPEKISHHLRQQLRWMRGSTIRSIWRFRYLPVNGWGYWEHFAAWVNFVLVTVAFVYLVLLSPFTGTWRSIPIMSGYAVLVALMTSLRYLTIRRSDQRLASQVLSWLIAPAMLLWTAVVLRSLRIYAIATCWHTGWGTRQRVEVHLVRGPLALLPEATPLALGASVPIGSMITGLDNDEELRGQHHKGW